MSIIELKAWQMREKLLSGQISSRELIEAHLARMEEMKDLNSFISHDGEQALRRADLIDKKIKKKEDLGLLAGLPLGIKDNIVTNDFKTTAGSKMLENFQSPYDATVVSRIKKEDGIILGKNNMDEFAMGGTNRTSYFGPVKNPIDTDKIPGGSSGGSAAAVASKEVPLSLGSDTGGSVRQPASYCSVVGFKPSYGMISRNGLIALSPSLDQIGILARDIKDIALLSNAISGHDPMDPNSYEGDSLIKLNENTAIDQIKGMKIGLPKEFFQLEMEDKVSEEIQRAIKRFEDAGAIVEEVSLPHLNYSPEIYMAITFADASSSLGRFDGIRYGYRAEDYDSLDELFIRSRSQSLGREAKLRILTGIQLLSGQNAEDYYKKAQKMRSLLIEDFKKTFASYDLLLTATNPRQPHSLDAKIARHTDYAEALNLAGLPGLSIPTSPGMTVGLQLIGNRFDDEKLLRAGLAYEGMVK